MSLTERVVFVVIIVLVLAGGNQLLPEGQRPIQELVRVFRDPIGFLRNPTRPALWYLLGLAVAVPVIVISVFFYLRVKARRARDRVREATGRAKERLDDFAANASRVIHEQRKNAKRG